MYIDQLSITLWFVSGHLGCFHLLLLWIMLLWMWVCIYLFKTLLLEVSLSLICHVYVTKWVTQLNRIDVYYKVTGKSSQFDLIPFTRDSWRVWCVSFQMCFCAAKEYHIYTYRYISIYIDIYINVYIYYWYVSMWKYLTTHLHTV